MHIKPKWAGALAVAVALGLAGCDEGGRDLPDAGDGGGDTETEWQSPIDGSVWGDAGEEEEVEPDCECSDPLCGIEYTCIPGEKECLCGTVCGDTLMYGFPDYVDFRCYAPCPDAVTCAREGDVCTSMGGQNVCLPHIEAASDGFDVKVMPLEQAWSIADAAQVDVELIVGGETRHLVMAFAAYYESVSYDLVYLVFMESSVGESYELFVPILGSAWAPGTLAISDDIDPATAWLYHLTESGDSWDVQSVGGISGSIELLETPEIEVCYGPGCPKAVFGPMQLEFVGIEAKAED